MNERIKTFTNRGDLNASADGDKKGDLMMGRSMGDVEVDQSVTVDAIELKCL